MGCIGLMRIRQEDKATQLFDEGTPLSLLHSMLLIVQLFSNLFWLTLYLRSVCLFVALVYVRCEWM